MKLSTMAAGPAARKSGDCSPEAEAGRHDDVEPALKLVDSIDELQEAVDDPKQFFLKLSTTAAGPAAKKKVIAHLKPKLEPQLPTPLTWADDVEPALELVDSIDELQEAVDDPKQFFLKLTTTAAGPAARKVVIAQLKPKLEPQLPTPLTWADVEPALELVDSIDELQEAVDDPKAFFMKLSTMAAGPAARKVVIAHLKPKLEPQLPTPLTWADDVEPALELVDSIDELRRAVDDPEAFFLKLTTTAAGPAARKVVIAQLKPKLEPQLPTPLTWADVEPALELVDSIDELQEAVDDPKQFFMKLTTTAVGPAARKVVIAQLKPKLGHSSPRR